VTASDEECELAVVQSEQGGAEAIHYAEAVHLDSRRQGMLGFAKQAGAPVARALVEGFERYQECLQELAQACEAQVYGGSFGTGDTGISSAPRISGPLIQSSHSDRW
jgi:hypothetical protein